MVLSTEGRRAAAAIADSSRFVRGESIAVLKRILADYEGPASPGSSDGTYGGSKRFLNSSVPSNAREFWDRILDIDFERIAATVSVEHLYQEALEVDSNGVDSSMMMDVDKPNDGNNVLDCY